MFSNILVGTDGSPSAMSAVRKAAELAKGQGATLHIVTAYTSAGMIQAAAADPIGAGVAGIASVSEKELADLARNVGAAAVAEASKVGAKAEAYALAGNPADVILEMAENTKADLVVVGNRGMRGARRFLGSVPNTVSHRAPCGVLIVQTA